MVREQPPGSVRTAKLVERALAGDREAERLLFEPHLEWLIAKARRHPSTREVERRSSWTPEDLAQEVVRRMLDSGLLTRFEDRGPLATVAPRSGARRICGLAFRIRAAAFRSLLLIARSRAPPSKLLFIPLTTPSPHDRQVRAVVDNLLPPLPSSGYGGRFSLGPAMLKSVVTVSSTLYAAYAAAVPRWGSTGRMGPP